MDWKENNNCVLATGFAQLPKGTPLFEMQKIIACVLVIDTAEEIIVEASFSFLMDLTNEFICSFIKGRSIRNGVEEITKEIEKKYIASEKKAITQALRGAYDRYLESKKN
ncbi:DUF3870 domain-containing protein [Peribacillus asahii]|uniref:DUF3870 domain-containing protein n=1 Tax=Peribacillus asahii TaxID=228899 RepID=UPI0038124479